MRLWHFTSKIYCNEISCEIDEFRVDTHLCKLCYIVWYDKILCYMLLYYMILYDIAWYYTGQTIKTWYHIYTACKDEFRRNLRSHSWSEFLFFIIYIFSFFLFCHCLACFVAFLYPVRYEHFICYIDELRHFGLLCFTVSMTTCF